MPNKLISLLLTISMLFCLSACGTTETSSNPTNTPSESQTDTPQNTDEITSIEPENSQVSSNTDESKEKDTTQIQTPVSQSKPTSTTNQSTHTHSYSDATCTSPKTCTRCGQTSGSALGHNYVNNKCSRCGKVDPDSLPVSLETLPVIDKDDYWFSTDLLTDTYGNSYTTAHRFNGRDSYAIYNINNQYSKFTAKIVLANTVASNHKSTVNIYADNNLIYTVSDISKTTGAKNVNVNVSNASTLKIEVISSSDWVHLERCCIVDAQLTK